MLKIVCVAQLFFMLLGGVSIACSSNFNRGELDIRCNLPKIGKVEVKISLAEMRALLPLYKNKEWGLWGQYHSSPNYGISTIDIHVNGKITIIPFSAYGDLLNPYKVTVRELDKSVAIAIEGGDTGVSYHAVLYFKESNDPLSDAAYLIKRRVKHCEFPDQLFEETTYSYVEGN